MTEQGSAAISDERIKRAATALERGAAVLLWLLAALMFAGALPALVESQGVSALMLWPGAALLAYAGRSVWRAY